MVLCQWAWMFCAVGRIVRCPKWLCTTPLNVQLRNPAQCAIVWHPKTATGHDCYNAMLFEWDGFSWEACMTSTYMHSHMPACLHLHTFSCTSLSTSITVLRSTDLPVIRFWYIMLYICMYRNFLALSAVLTNQRVHGCFYSILFCRGEESMTAEQR